MFIVGSVYYGPPQLNEPNCGRYYVWELGRYLALSGSFVVGFIICGGSGNWIGSIGSGYDRMKVKRRFCLCLLRNVVG